jgi:SAM-dependent methyltransferase
MASVYNPSFSDFYTRHWSNVALIFGRVVPLLLPRIADRPNRCLDVGCGSGEFPEALASAGYSVTGVDFSESLLALARTRLAPQLADGRIKLIHADMSEMKLDETYRIATSLYYVLNHVASPALDQTLTRICDHLEPSGVVLFHLRSLGQFEASDGEVSIKKEHGGLIVKRFLRIGDAEYMSFHNGYYKDAEGTTRDFEFRVRLHGYSVGDVCGRLATRGLTHALVLDVGADLAAGSGSSPKITRVEISRADSARDVVVFASREQASIDALATRLGSLG